MEQESNKREASFWTAKKSEYEWAKTIDAFFLNLTPAWFDFVTKLLLLGALKYLKDHENNWLVTIIYAFSFIIFYFYLQSILYNFPFYRFLPESWIKNDRFAFGFSIIVAGILLLVINLMLNSVVAAFAVK
jgi:hypothetical protein